MDARAEFELAVKSKWSDSYIFNLEASGRYVYEILEAMFWAWQASRQALDSGEPLGYVAPRMLADIKAGKYFGINMREASRDDAIAIYAHPVSTHRLTLGQRKAAQIGQIIGVLVQTEPGKVTAVTDLGRCTSLNQDVTGSSPEKPLCTMCGGSDVYGDCPSNGRHIEQEPSQ